MTDTHELQTTGPHPYPGGKDGWFTTSCSCRPEKVWWGATAAASAKPAEAHQRAMRRQR